MEVARPRGRLEARHRGPVSGRWSNRNVNTSWQLQALVSWHDDGCHGATSGDRADPDTTPGVIRSQPDRQKGRYVETFVVESWLEHLRQHERITVGDRTVQEGIRRFHIAGTPPVVTHLIAAKLRRS